MTSEQFAALVHRLEVQAQRRPRAYRLKVYLLAMLGNVYLGLVLVLIVALLLALVASVVVLRALAVKPIVVVALLLWMILKALWVRLAAPDGIEVDAARAPELFAMLERLRRALDAPRFDRVLVTDDFNAAVVQVPRLGVFGWPRNLLVVGLPLMKSLTVAQLEAVLAHELGHLAGGHGRLAGWVYRQRLRWSRLAEMLDANRSRSSFLFKPFMRWFAPYLNAYSFPMARANEYEADATAARLASPRAAAEALTGVSVVGSYLAERYWPGVLDRADEHPRPAFAPFVGMGDAVLADLDDAAAHGWLERALGEETTTADTHPALRDRLAAIGEAPRVALPGASEAADRLLGDALPEITAAFDRRWQEQVQPYWEARHREYQEGRARLSELDARCAGGAELALPDAFERARLTERIADDADGALAQFRALHERAPDDAAACYCLGVRLLARDDDAGGALVERAMSIDEDAITVGCTALRDYHWRHGREDVASAWHRRLLERQKVEAAAQAERSEVRAKDRFEPHGLSAEALATLVAELRGVARLRRAYLVRKRVQHRPDRPLYILGYRVTGRFRLRSAKRVRDAARAIHDAVRFPGETLIVSVEGDNRRLDRRLRRVRGARIL